LAHVIEMGIEVFAPQIGLSVLVKEDTHAASMKRLSNLAHIGPILSCEGKADIILIRPSGTTVFNSQTHGDSSQRRRTGYRWAD
jgi:hypothetical protein